MHRTSASTYKRQVRKAKRADRRKDKQRYRLLAARLRRR